MDFVIIGVPAVLHYSNSKWEGWNFVSFSLVMLIYSIVCYAEQLQYHSHMAISPADISHSGVSLKLLFKKETRINQFWLVSCKTTLVKWTTIP